MIWILSSGTWPIILLSILYCHRFTLWRCLQSDLTPILAHILEVLDRDANLDLAYCAGLSEGMIDLWLNILEDKQILELTILQTSGYSTFSL